MEQTADVTTPQELEAEGIQEYQQGNYYAAAKNFAAAEEGYRMRGEPLKAVELANNRSVALLQADQPDAALQAVSGTMDVFREAGDQKGWAMALGNRAAALDALRRDEEAMQDYQASADLLKEIGEHDLRMVVMKSLSALQLRSGKSLQALATMQAGVDGVDTPPLKYRLLQRLLKIPNRLLGR